jgi:hypothetical protein
LRGVQETLEKRGLFCSFYSDRGSHYWTTPEEGGKVDEANPTQFGRALDELGIERIAAYSPQARGRSERLFKTWQDRLPKELKLKGITDIQTANHYLQSHFVDDYNRRFQVAALGEGDAFVDLLGCQLNDILCLKSERVVNRNNIVQYRGRDWQIPRQRGHSSYAKKRVKVHEYEDHSIAIFHGPRCLVRFTQEGQSFSKIAA